MSIGLVVVVSLACGVAAMARYGLSLMAAHETFPWPTVVANTVGSALFATALALYSKGSLSFAAYAVITAGLAGGLTTFSTLAVDAVRLWSTGRRGGFAAYLTATLGLGLAASWAAWSITISVLAVR